MKKILFLIAFAFTGIVNCAKAQTNYHEDDKEGLRIFLRQPSAEAGKINAQQLGLTINDTLNWQNSEAWIEKIADFFYWNDELPKRLIKIVVDYPYSVWYGRNLAGILDASKWSKLTILNCSDNKLHSLDVSKNSELIELNCNYCQLIELNVRNNAKLKN